MNDFVIWLNAEIEKRGWSYRELARRAKLSGAAVSQVMTMKLQPAWNFCDGIAHALGYEPEFVFRKAGLLPLLPPEVAEEQEIIRIIRGLPAGRRAAALDMLRGLARKPQRELAPQQESGAAIIPSSQKDTDVFTPADLEPYPIPPEKWEEIKRLWTELQDATPEALRPYLLEIIQTAVL